MNSATVATTSLSILNEAQVASLRWLIIGADGLIGAALLHKLAQAGANVIASSRRSGSIHHFLDLAAIPADWQPPPADVVVITAAVCRIDACEANPAASEKINVDAALVIAERAWAQGSFVVFLSSSGVFDGVRSLPGPLTPPQPTNTYGRQKAKAEALLQTAAGAQHGLAIIRPTKVLDASNPLLREWHAQVSQGKIIAPHAWRWMAPLSLKWVAQAILIIAAERVSGIWHLSAAEDVSFAGFAKQWVQALGLPVALVHPEVQPDVPKQRAVMDMSATNARFNLNPPLLSETIAALVGDISNSAECPICTTVALLPFARFNDVPASGVLCSQPEEVVPRRDLVFAYCPECAFVCQQQDKAPQIDYTEVSRPTARQLPDYAARLIERLRQERTDELVMEVGCNDGTFLSELRAAGFSRLLGIEPSLALAAAARQAGHEVASCALDLVSSQAVVAQHSMADIVICRHTLEHVPEPLAFLAAVRSLLKPGALACIEVPSLAPVIERLHVQELWDEHLSYFLPDNLRTALEAADFSVDLLEVVAHRDMENIVVWARAVSPKRALAAPLNKHVALCASFSARWAVAAEHLRNEVSKTPQARIALGASHPQANLLNFAGLSGMVDAVIDDDPAKVGRWLPLKDHNVPVYSSESMPELLLGGTLLLTGFGYPAWMTAARISADGRNAEVVDVRAQIVSQLTEPQEGST